LFDNVPKRRRNCATPGTGDRDWNCAMTKLVEASKLEIPISKPFFGTEELAAVQQTLESGWVVQGPWVRQFEDKFSAFIGCRFSIATSSCTTALQVAVSALRLKQG